jgi:hypothetical protein
MELIHDSAIPLLGMYLKELKSTYNENTCTLMSIDAQFTTAKS